LEKSSDGVIGHVNGGVRKRFNDELVIPRKLCSETLSSGATPLFKPVNNQLEFMLSLGVISLEVFRKQVFSNEFFPAIFTVFQEPLVAACNDALIAGSGDDFTLWLIVWKSKIEVIQVLFDLWLSLLDCITLGNTNEHFTFVETLEISFIFGLFKFFFVILRGNFQLVDQENSGHVSELWDIDDWHW